MWSPSPTERAISTLRREYGPDKVCPQYDRDHEEAAEALAAFPRLMEVWCPCPLHPNDGAFMRVKSTGPFGVASFDSADFTCVRGCEHDRIAEEVRVLELRQEARELPMQPLASLLAIRVKDLEDRPEEEAVPA